MSFGRIMRNTNMGKSLIDIGKSFVSSESSPLGKQILILIINLIFIYHSAMVSRYFILSGIPLSRITICDEIQNMISYLVENLRPVDSHSIPAKERLSTAIKSKPTKKGMENYFVFFSYYLIKIVQIKYYIVMNIFLFLSSASFANWT